MREGGPPRELRLGKPSLAIQTKAVTRKRVADRIELPARPTDEPRFLIVGQIRQDLWTAAVTYRHEETIRLISVRHARDNEKKQYVDTREGRHEAGHDHG